MAIRVYRDNEANSVVFDITTVDPRFTNSLHAVETDAGLIDVFDLHGPTDKKEFSDIPYTEILTEDGSPGGANVQETVDYLNSQFSAFAGGGPGGVKPTITSSLTESVVEGEPFNYQITATENPFYFDASGLPVGLSINHEQGLIFGSTAVTGVASISISAVNGFGTTTETLSLTVLASGPGFVNTKSIRFRGSTFREYLNVGTTAANQRASNQTWSISFWLYLNAVADSDLWADGTNGNRYQGIFLLSDGKVRVQVADSGDNLTVETSNSLSASTWYHVLVTNDGLETTSSFKVYFDGVLQSMLVIDNDLDDSQGGTSTQRICRAAGGQGFADYFDGYIDEWSYYDTELSAANAVTLYNGGVPVDLSSTGFAGDMQVWLRMGDGDTYPTLTDNSTGGAHDTTMVNMTVSSIVSFTP